MAQSDLVSDSALPGQFQGFKLLVNLRPGGGGGSFWPPCFFADSGKTAARINFVYLFSQHFRTLCENFDPM